MSINQSLFSNPSYNVNIPEVKNFSGQFFYNFYVNDERVNAVKSLTPNSSPRYVSLSWNLSSIDAINTTSSETVSEILSKLVSEDNTFSNQYFSRNFSEILDIKNCALDLKNFYELRQNEQIQSLKDTKDVIINGIFETNDKIKNNTNQIISDINQAYNILTDLPASSLGLDIFDENENSLSKEDMLKTQTDALSLNIKFSKLISNDILTKSTIDKKELIQFVKNTNSSQDIDEDIDLIATSLDGIKPGGKQGDIDLPRIKGYLLRRFRYTENGNLQEELVEFIGNPNINSYLDTSVVYGGIYLYSINVIAELDLVGLIPQNNQTYKSTVLTINIESRPILTNVSCFEFKPPLPPADIKFYLNTLDQNLTITWDFPAESQGDIRQFQIFRRRSLDHPFELIYQYGFDRSIPGYIPNIQTSIDFFNSDLTEQKTFSNKKFTTGEEVDANNIENMKEEYKNLVKDSAVPILHHIDKDFIIDSEFFTSSEFIYALASIDAHGMISNYSTQYKVSYDLYKNKLISSVVCDEGALRAYPNSTLVIDTFKDSINTTGMNLKDIEIYFHPDNFQVVNQNGKQSDVVLIQKSDMSEDIKPYYHFQLINLDNQLMKSIRLNIKEDKNLELKNDVVVSENNQSIDDFFLQEIEDFID